jgi:predicted Abi (CAAX) family protease
MALKVGDKVTILVGTPEGHPVSGTVKVVQDEVGKKIGVELDEYTVYAHSLDGLVDEREQGNGLPVVGKGWWTIEDDVVVNE